MPARMAEMKSEFIKVASRAMHATRSTIKNQKLQQQQLVAVPYSTCSERNTQPTYTYHTVSLYGIWE